MKKCAAAAFVLIAALFLSVSCASVGKCQKSAAGSLKIGWGKRSIAMPGPVPISGQFHLRVSQGTHTPVETSALVLENGKDSVIFVSCDVVSVRPPVLLAVKEMLKKEIPGFPVEKIIINATHTHAGPSTNDIVINYPNKVKVVPSAQVQQFIARQVADAVKEAWNTRAPGAVSYGYGFATTGHSRRAIYLKDMGQTVRADTGVAVNGHGIMYGNTNHKEFASYEAGTDPFINLLYTFDAAGKLTGAVINVPCPSQTSESVWAYNASFWHNVREKLTARYGRIGVIAQSAAAGDLAPRQLHYKAAEKRRYLLKYQKEIADYIKKPMPRPAVDGVVDNDVAADSSEVVELMRAEDIANRIIAAFEEVLSWAGKEKFSSPVLKHEVRTVRLARQTLSKALVEDEKRKHAASMKEKFITEGDQWDMLVNNSRLSSRRNRMAGIAARYESEKKDPFLSTDIHAVRIGNIAFATNRFELFMDYMHRIQARSPFEQTFVVQLVTDPMGSGSYLATERGEKNKGYSANPYSNRVSHKGGQHLVNETVKLLKEMTDKKKAIVKNDPVVTVPKVQGAPAQNDWQKAPVLKNFCHPSGNGMQKAPVAFRMLHDGKFLYIKADCGMVNKGDKLVAPPAAVPARDASIWKYESLEFCLGKGNESYQFIFAPGSKLMDLAHTAAAEKSGVSWNCKKVKLTAAVTSSGWEAALALPLDELKFNSKGQANRFWFNVHRTNYYRTAQGRSEREGGAYLPLNGSFKNIENIGTLILAK